LAASLSGSVPSQIPLQPRAGDLEQREAHRPADAAPLPGLADADLADEHRGRLVGMQQHGPRGEADHLVPVEGEDDLVQRIVEEGARLRRIDGVVEQPLAHRQQQGQVRWTEHPKRDVVRHARPRSAKGEG